MVSNQNLSLWHQEFLRAQSWDQFFFFAYINTSQVRLFADDTAIYLTLDSRHDSDCLERDLDRLQAWELKWDMEFNPSNWQVVHVTSSRAPFNTKNILHGQVLEVVTSARYLVIDISNNLSWNTHMNRIASNANRSLGFIKWNVKTKSPKVWEMTSNPCPSPAGVSFSNMGSPHLDQLAKPTFRSRYAHTPFGSEPVPTPSS